MMDMDEQVFLVPSEITATGTEFETVNALKENENPNVSIKNPRVNEECREDEIEIEEKKGQFDGVEQKIFEKISDDHLFKLLEEEKEWLNADKNFTDMRSLLKPVKGDKDKMDDTEILTNEAHNSDKIADEHLVPNVDMMKNNDDDETGESEMIYNDKTDAKDIIDDVIASVPEQDEMKSSTKDEKRQDNIENDQINNQQVPESLQVDIQYMDTQDSTLTTEETKNDDNIVKSTTDLGVRQQTLENQYLFEPTVTPMIDSSSTEKSFDAILDITIAECEKKFDMEKVFLQSQHIPENLKNTSTQTEYIFNHSCDCIDVVTNIFNEKPTPKHKREILALCLERYPKKMKMMPLFAEQRQTVCIVDNNLVEESVQKTKSTPQEKEFGNVECDDPLLIIKDKEIITNTEEVSNDCKNYDGKKMIDLEQGISTPANSTFNWSGGISTAPVLQLVQRPIRLGLSRKKKMIAKERPAAAQN